MVYFSTEIWGTFHLKYTLFRKKIISENLTSRLEGIAGFRNILVHEYGDIDRRRVYQYLLEKLELFNAFKKEILNWLKSKSL